MIIECCLLSDEEKCLAAQLAAAAGADWVKTSTGMSVGGATVKDVALLVQASHLPVKASGGIRSWGELSALKDAGATRFGCSATRTILQQITGQD